MFQFWDFPKKFNSYTIFQSMYNLLELNSKSIEELYAIAEELKIEKVKSYSQQDLVYKILDEQAIQGIGRTKPERPKRERIKVKKVTQEEPQQISQQEVVQPQAKENEEKPKPVRKPRNQKKNTPKQEIAEQQQETPDPAK